MSKSITFAVTFVVFLLEALLHFNVGKHGTMSLSNLSLPNAMELVDIVKVLAIFSAINAYAVPMVESW